MSNSLRVKFCTFSVNGKRAAIKRISESSVYRILKANNLISSPTYTVLSAADKFEQPTKQVNELWQIDFTYLKVIHWDWYYLATVLDDYSRYILSWRLCSSMSASEVNEMTDEAIAATGVDHAHIVHRPKLLSDNGPCFISHDLKDYLDDRGIRHIRSKPFHPMTQGKIERYHESLDNVTPADVYHGRSEEILSRRK